MGIGNRSGRNGGPGAAPEVLEWEDFFLVEEPAPGAPRVASGKEPAVVRQGEGQVSVGSLQRTAEDDSLPELPQVETARRKQYGRLCDWREKLEYMTRVPGQHPHTTIRAIQTLLALEKRESELLDLDSRNPASDWDGKIPIQLIQQVVIQHE